MNKSKIIISTISAISVYAMIASASFAAPVNEFTVYEEDFRSTGVASTVLTNEMDWHCRAEYLKSGEYAEINRTGTRLRELISMSDEGTQIKNTEADFKAWIYKMYNNKYLSSYLEDNYYVEMNIKVDDYVTGFDGENRFSAMFQFSQESGDDLIMFSVEEDGIRYFTDGGWQNYADYTPGNDVHNYRLEVFDGMGTMYIDDDEMFSYTLPVSEEYVNIRFGCGSRGEFDQGQCVISDMKFVKCYSDDTIVDTFIDLSQVTNYESVETVNKDLRYGTENGISFEQNGYIEYDLTKDYGITGLMLNFTAANSEFDNIKITAWDLIDNELEMTADLFEMVDFEGRLSNGETIRRTFLPNNNFDDFINGNFSITKLRIEYTGNTDNAVDLLNAEISYSGFQYPSYEGMTAGLKEIKNGMISPAVGSIELGFSCDARILNNEDGDIKLLCNETETEISVEKEGTNIIIRPINGFIYGADYKLTISEKLVNSGIENLPSELSFETYTCDYEVSNISFGQGNCTFTLKSNYTENESVAVMIVSYKDGMILDMNSKETAINSGEEKQITTGNIVTENADDVVVMIWDNLRSRKALVKTVRQGE